MPESRDTHITRLTVEPTGTPPIAGFADQVSIARRPPNAHEFIFFDSLSNSIVARLVVDNGALVEHLWANSADFYDEIRKKAEASGVSPVPPAKDHPNVEQTVAKSANFFRLYASGTEASVDAYYIPPALVYEAGQARRSGAPKTKIKASPILQVQLGGPLLLGLLEAIKGVVLNLKEAAGE